MTKPKSSKTILREFRACPSPIEKTEHTVEGCKFVVDVKLPAGILYLSRRLAKLDFIEIEGKVPTAMEESRFTDTEKLSHRTTGKKGEFALSAHLFADWIQVLEFMENRYGHDFEFNGYLFDIKTDGKPRPSWMNLQVPIKHVQSTSPYDFYVGCCLQAADLVRIWGYATRAELEQIEPIDKGYGSDCNIPYRDLHRPLREIKHLPPKSV
jgi:hypothetical protein